MPTIHSRNRRKTCQDLTGKGDNETGCRKEKAPLEAIFRDYNDALNRPDFERIGRATASTKAEIPIFNFYLRQGRVGPEGPQETIGQSTFTDMKRLQVQHR